MAVKALNLEGGDELHRAVGLGLRPDDVHGPLEPTLLPIEDVQGAESGHDREGDLAEGVDVIALELDGALDDLDLDLGVATELGTDRGLFDPVLEHEPLGSCSQRLGFLGGVGRLGLREELGDLVGGGAHGGSFRVGVATTRRTLLQGCAAV
jgi:hypothetical protein